MTGRDDAYRLGWLGVGRMGTEMGRRLLEAGCDLAVFNRSMSKAEPLPVRALQATSWKLCTMRKESTSRTCGITS